MFSVLTRVEGEMRFFEGVPPSLSFPPSPLPAFLSALTYNGCPATDPPAGSGEEKISVFLSARGRPLPRHPSRSGSDFLRRRVEG